MSKKKKTITETFVVYSEPGIKKKDILDIVERGGVGHDALSYEPYDLNTVLWEITITVKKGVETK